MLLLAQSLGHAQSYQHTHARVEWPQYCFYKYYSSSYGHSKCVQKKYFV